MAEEAPVTTEEQKKKSKLPLKTIIIILAVLLLEGGTITVFMAFKGGPKPAEGTNPIEGETKVEQKEFAEITLAESFSVDNYMGGKTRLVITMEVCAKVAKDKEEEFGGIVESHKTEIRDAIRTLVASAQPDQIKDPKLQVVKREIKTGVEKIVGEGVMQEILVSSWQSYTAD
jgi:flagellar basal body-associated protein FliL